MSSTQFEIATDGVPEAAWREFTDRDAREDAIAAELAAAEPAVTDPGF